MSLAAQGLSTEAQGFLPAQGLSAEAQGFLLAQGLSTEAQGFLPAQGLSDEAQGFSLTSCWVGEIVSATEGVIKKPVKLEVRMEAAESKAMY